MKGPHHFIGQIMEAICKTHLKGIASHICYGNRPSAGKEKDDFIVVSTSSRVGEHGAYQQMGLYIEIYVRNLQNGVPNIRKIQSIEDKVVEAFPIVEYDENNPLVWRWKATDPNLQIKGDDQLGFSAWMVRASLQVNTTDRYALEQEDNTTE